MYSTKIAICENKYIAAITNIKRKGYRVYDSLEAVSKDLDKVSIIIGNPDKDLLRQCFNLEYLQILSAGMNGYDDRKLYKEPDKVIIGNASGVYSIPMAEYTIGAMLLMGKKSLSHYLCAKNHFGGTLAVNPLFDIEFRYATVAVYGTGSIGSEIASLLKGMNCSKIIGINRSGKNNQAFDEIVALNQSKQVLRSADYFISVMPDNNESYGYWTLEKFSLMKRNAVFVNIGRGSAVITKDLVWALKHNVISGAVLDVVNPEPISSISRIRLTKRLLITNHSSWYSQNNHERLERLLTDNLTRFFNHEEIINRCFLI